jgi:hypothetical protein
MDRVRSITSDALVALGYAIDAAMDRGDVDEAVRLSSLQWEELSRWLEDHGYPPLQGAGGPGPR